jgi:hypothetical protein
MKTLFFGLTLLAAIGIGIYGFSWDDEATRIGHVSDARYAQWLKITPDKTLLSSRNGFSGLPDSLARQAEEAIGDAHVLSEHYAALQLKLERLATVSALLLVGVSAWGIALSRVKHQTNLGSLELKTEN